MEWTAWIPTAITAFLVLLVFVGKHSIKAEIEKSVQHKFDAKIERKGGKSLSDKTVRLSRRAAW